MRTAFAIVAVVLTGMMALAFFSATRIEKPQYVIPRTIMCGVPEGSEGRCTVTTNEITFDGPVGSVYYVRRGR